MATWMWIVIAIAAVVIVGLVIWGIVRARRTATLRDRFGPEYDRTLASRDGRRDAERDLEARRERRDQLEIRPLSLTARDRYTTLWTQTQARFVDDPMGSLRDADSLVATVMNDRGYPMDRFEQRAADISVDHPVVVENYRNAHAATVATDEGRSSTEDMRRGIQHYRMLFEELLDTGDGAQAVTDDGSQRDVG
jgi:hypothetical protein